MVKKHLKQIRQTDTNHEIYRNLIKNIDKMIEITEAIETHSVITTIMVVTALGEMSVDTSTRIQMTAGMMEIVRGVCANFTILDHLF